MKNALLGHNIAALYTMAMPYALPKRWNYGRCTFPWILGLGPGTADERQTQARQVLRTAASHHGQGFCLSASSDAVELSPGRYMECCAVDRSGTAPRHCT